LTGTTSYQSSSLFLRLRFLSGVPSATAQWGASGTLSLSGVWGLVEIVREILLTAIEKHGSEAGDPLRMKFLKI